MLLRGLLLMLTLSTAWAADEEEASAEVIVRSEPFKRWDDSRWRIDMQMGMPYQVGLYAVQNWEIPTVAIDLRAVVACDLGARRSRNMMEVGCVFEDVSLSAATWMRKTNDHHQQVLDETNALLDGLRFLLHVTADGRVTDVGVLDKVQGNRRQIVIYENVRQIVSRMMVGFHLRLSEELVVGETWTESNSTIMQLPSFRFAPMGTGPQDATVVDIQGSGDMVAGGKVDLLPSSLNGLRSSAMDATQAPASAGQSLLAHRMDKYKGAYLVQTSGTGTADVGADIPLPYHGAMSAVSIFNPADGVMVERVWQVVLSPTGSSPLAEGAQGWPYWQTGRLRMLGADEVSEVPPPAIYAPPQITRTELPPWPSLE